MPYGYRRGRYPGIVPLVLLLSSVATAGSAPPRKYVDTYLGLGWCAECPASEVNWSAHAIAVDPTGNILSAGNPGRANILVRFEPGGAGTWVAGTMGAAGAEDDGQPAREVDLGSVLGIALESSGSVLLSSFDRQVIRRVDNEGTIHTVAGQWNLSGSEGDGGPATAALLRGPSKLAIGPDGAIYFCEIGKVRRIREDGVVETVVGNGTNTTGGAGDGGLATEASLPGPNGLGWDTLGRLYVADALDGRVRRVGLDGIIETVAGTTYVPEYSGDGGPAIDAGIGTPSGLVVMSDGSFFCGDSHFGVVRHVDASGLIATVAGTGEIGYDGENVPAASSRLGRVQDLTRLPDGRLLIAEDDTHRIRVLENDSTLVTLVGNGFQLWGGDGHALEQASFGLNGDIDFSNDGVSFVADTNNGRIRRIGLDGVVNTVAGTGEIGSEGDEGPALQASLSPIALELGSTGDLYFLGFRLRRIDSLGIVHAVAGTGVRGFSGDGGDARLAEFRSPTDFTLAADGSIYIADTDNHRVRRIDAAGVIQTILGNGTASSTGDGGPMEAATVDRPGSVAFGPDGSMYVSELGGHVVRRVDPTGTIDRYAGGNGPGFGGDGGPATEAQLNVPVGMTFDQEGRMYICDSSNHRVRVVDLDGTIHTVAGNGEPLYNGPEGPGRTVNIQKPLRFGMDGAGYLYTTSQFSGQVRRLRPIQEVAVAFHSLRTDWESGKLVLRWWAENSGGLEFEVLRRVDPSRTWVSIVRTNLPSGPAVEFVDESVPLSEELSYVVRVFRKADGVELASLGPVEVMPAQEGPVRTQGLGLVPNPSSVATRVWLKRPHSRPIDFRVYDLRGRWVRDLGRIANESTGVSAIWDGVDARGHRVANGVYQVLAIDDRGRVVASARLVVLR